MTRDEAIRKVEDAGPISWPANFVDLLARLGLLKLEEPTHPTAVYFRGYSVSWDELVKLVGRHGYKVVSHDE